MSNDTYCTLRFRHKSKKYLQEVRKYAEAKKARWDAFEATGNDVTVLLNMVGAKNRSEVVSWGFEFENIVEDGDGYCLPAWAWANENLRNVHLTGEDGELAEMLTRFPELVIEGEFEDSYGWGAIRGFEKDYEGKGEKPMEGDLNSSFLVRYRYYPDSEVLKLELSNGCVYRYEGVSQVDIDNLKIAESTDK